MIRLLHTADWHLGKTLKGQSREHEHRQFLSWLLEALEEHEVDALLIAGDVFDTFNPTAYAERMWYEFLTRARRRCPSLDIVVTSGNHDSAARLQAPRPMLGELGITVVGRIEKNAAGELDLESLVVDLSNRDGDVEALCLAVPFLRRADLPIPTDAENPLADGVRAVYSETLEIATRRARPDQAIVAMGHLTIDGARTTEASERPIHIGGQDAMSTDLFDVSLDYTALGHLHMPQGFEAEGRIRYSGSPIPLSMAEVTYDHQVVLVDLDAGKLAAIQQLLIPRTVDMIRIPEDGPGRLEAVLEEIEGLPEIGDPRAEPYPFLDIQLELDRPTAGVRNTIESALANRAVRLIRIANTYQESQKFESDISRDLEELTPEEVFHRLHVEEYERPPDDELTKAFNELVASVREGGPS